MTTIKDATYRWVATFNAIPQDLMKDALRGQRWKFTELTPYVEDEEDYLLDWLPMWGWLWSFGDNIDDWWLKEKGGLEKMKECGFRVYEHEDYGYWFGIDGCGYDFYEDHWIPLYKARGLQWHDTEEE